MWLLYFLGIGSIKFCETCAKPVTTTDYNVLHFHQLEATQDLVDAFRISFVKVFDVGISRWRRHPTFSLNTFSRSVSVVSC